MEETKISTLAKAVDNTDIMLRVGFAVGFIVYAFAVMNYIIEGDAVRAILATAAAWICAGKV